MAFTQPPTERARSGTEPASLPPAPVKEIIPEPSPGEGTGSGTSGAAQAGKHRWDPGKEQNK